MNRCEIRMNDFGVTTFLDILSLWRAHCDAFKTQSRVLKIHTQAHPEVRDLIKPRLLVADDNAESLRMLCWLVSEISEIVGTAFDGKAALDAIRECKPDIVVLDLEMPELNGIEVTRELMKSNLAPRVVICSVYDDKEIAEAALKAGALAFIPKAACRRLLAKAIESAARGEPFHDLDTNAVEEP